MVPAGILLVHTVVTVPPFPRTAFTLAAGLLFAHGGAYSSAVVSSTPLGIIAILLVLLPPAGSWCPGAPAERSTTDGRLRGELVYRRCARPVPFAAINYAAGASGVRILSLLGDAASSRHRGGHPGRRVRR